MAKWTGGRRPGEVDWGEDVRDDTERAEHALYALIALNVLVFVVWSFQYDIPAIGTFMREHFRVSLPAVLSGRVWTLLTMGFSHSDTSHLVWNMVMLFIFGREIGRSLGTNRLLHLYVMGAIVASLGHLLYGAATGDITAALGASGAVMAVGATFAAMFPNRIFFPGFPAWVLFSVFVLLDLTSLIQGGGNIAHAAHLGGALYGFGFWYFWIRRPPQNFPKGRYGNRL